MHRSLMGVWADNRGPTIDVCTGIGTRNSTRYNKSNSTDTTGKHADSNDRRGLRAGDLYCTLNSNNIRTSRSAEQQSSRWA